jgi:hypothetical protein
MCQLIKVEDLGGGGGIWGGTVIVYLCECDLKVRVSLYSLHILSNS